MKGIWDFILMFPVFVALCVFFSTPLIGIVKKTIIIGINYKFISSCFSCWVDFESDNFAQILMLEKEEKKLWPGFVGIRWGVLNSETPAHKAGMIPPDQMPNSWLDHVFFVISSAFNKISVGVYIFAACWLTFGLSFREQTQKLSNVGQAQWNSPANSEPKAIWHSIKAILVCFCRWKVHWNMSFQRVCMVVTNG